MELLALIKDGHTVKVEPNSKDHNDLVKKGFAPVTQEKIKPEKVKEDHIKDPKA